MTEHEHNPMDSAALAAGAIAAVLAISGPPGPFDLMSLINGVVITGVLLTYEYPRPRTKSQSVAFGAVLGLSFLPIVGFAMEFFLTSRDITLGFLLDGAGVPPIESSNVPKWLLAVSWILLSALFGFIVSRYSSAGDFKGSS